jgi:predicted nucleic acid binding AN1-type Zn finger protein
MPTNDKVKMDTYIYRTPEQQRLQPLTEPPPLALKESQAATSSTSQKRCVCCPKKLTLTDFACGKCKHRFCSTHRLPEQHSCGHDFRAEGARQLAAANPVVVAAKVDKI